jgi:predicted peroxiredoxin
MSKFQFVISAGPENPNRATRAVMFASRAADEGHDVTVFLVDDAVYLANLALAHNVKASTGDDLMTYLNVLLDNRVPVRLCLPCVKARKVDETNLPEGWTIEKGVEAIRADDAGYKTWVF